MRALLRLLPLLIILTAGCGTAVLRPAGAPGAEAAQSAYDRGDYTTAAREYQRLADQGPAAQRDSYRLSAADAWLAAGQPERTRELLRPLERAKLPPELAGRRQLVEARLAIDDNRIENALRLLAQPAARDLPPSYTAELLRLRAQAYERRGSQLEAARALVDREPLLRDPEQVARNQESIWRVLDQLSLNDLKSRRARPAPDTLGGWMELAAIAKQGEAGERALADWRRSYPQHPARKELLRSITARASERPAGAVRGGGRIAVLLPLTGKFASAAAAVRDGIMGAYYETGPATGRQLKLYDVGENPAQTLSAYEQALAEGAEVVIGPLSKEGAAALARRGQFPVPTLMLNYAEAPASDNLFQFSLAPEDEARRIADFAARQGLSRAAVLTPASDSGERLRQAFEARWRELGGEVVASNTYSPSDNDYSEPVRQLLGSDGRKRGTGSQVRQEIQFIFLGATAREGRLLRPMLKYHYAGQLPTLSTSHVYAGRPQPRLDGDLDGIVFEDMPWLIGGPGVNTALRNQIAQTGKPQDGEVARLTAFGVDAYNLAPSLRALARSPAEHYSGQTGILSVDAQHRIQREPVFAQFRSGEPQLLGDAPLMQGSGAPPGTP